MLKGELIYLGCKTIKTKDGSEFTVVKLGDEKRFENFELMLAKDTAVPTAIKEGTKINVGIILSQIGFKLRGTVHELGVK